MALPDRKSGSHSERPLSPRHLCGFFRICLLNVNGATGAGLLNGVTDAGLLNNGATRAGLEK
jgi:hypothetical protein